MISACLWLRDGVGGLAGLRDDRHVCAGRLAAVPLFAHGQKIDCYARKQERCEQPERLAPMGPALRRPRSLTAERILRVRLAVCRHFAAQNARRDFLWQCAPDAAVLARKQARYAFGIRKRQLMAALF
jgi:hypothetical protein